MKNKKVVWIVMGLILVLLVLAPIRTSPRNMPARTADNMILEVMMSMSSCVATDPVEQIEHTALHKNTVSSTGTSLRDLHDSE